MSKKGAQNKKESRKIFFQFSQQGQGTKMRKNDWTDFSFQHRFSIDARKKTKQSLKTKLNKDVLVLNLSRHQHSKNAATSNSFLSEYFIFNSFSRTILCHQTVTFVGLFLIVLLCFNYPLYKLWVNHSNQYRTFKWFY